MKAISEVSFVDHPVPGSRRGFSGIRRKFWSRVNQFFLERVEPGKRVLDIGCGAGELLREVNPMRGLGVDINPAILNRDKSKHLGQANLEYRIGDAQQLSFAEAFDYIILNYSVGYMADIQAVFGNLISGAHPRTRLLITSLNHLWLVFLRWATRLRIVGPQPPSNWLSTSDLVGLLELAGWEVIEASTIQLCPIEIPVVSELLNRFIGRLPGFRWLGVTQTFVARPRMMVALPNQLTCSVIVPARNEAGNIKPALERIPTLGARTEVIFVEGNSSDDTWQEIQRQIAEYKGPLKLLAIQQPGRGKWDAVRSGFDLATGEVLVIQDADLTAPPEDLPKFFEAIISGVAEFANGSRLVYPMEEKAMRFLNLLGNKFLRRH